jgi:hypothetical protein
MWQIIVAIGFSLAFSIQAKPQHAETQKVRQSPAGEVKAIPPEMTRRFGELRPKLQPTASAWVNQQAHALTQKTALDLHALEIAIQGRFDNANANGNTNSSARSRGDANANGNTNSNARSRGDGNNLSDSDIEGVAFIVMMQATNDMDKDLKAIMDEVKSMTAAQAKLRDLINQVNKDVANNAKQDAPCLTPVCRSLPSQLSQLAAMTANLQKPVRMQVPPHVTFASLQSLENQLKQQLDSMNELSEMTSLRLQMMMDRRSKFISTLSNIMKKISTTQDTLVQNLK